MQMATKLKCSIKSIEESSRLTTMENSVMSANRFGHLPSHRLCVTMEQ